MAGWETWDLMKTIVDEDLCRAFDVIMARVKSEAPTLQPDGELEQIVAEHSRDLDQLRRYVDQWIAKQIQGAHYTGLLRCEGCRKVISYDTSVKPDRCPHCGHVFARHVTCATCNRRLDFLAFERAGHKCPFCFPS